MAYAHPDVTRPNMDSWRRSALAEKWVPKLVLAPSLAASLVFVYGFMLVTGYLSFTASTMMPRYTFTGVARYRDLFAND